MIREFKLMRECFPKTWLRKMPLLLFKKSYIEIDNAIVSMLITFGDRIILLCTHPAYRNMGYASRLINGTSAFKTYTYEGNTTALKFWKSCGYNEIGKKKSILGEKVLLLNKDKKFTSDYMSALYFFGD